MNPFLSFLVGPYGQAFALMCSPSIRERLTYGTLYHETSVELTGDEVYTKKESENFILATYGDTTCGCWVYYSRVLDHLAKYDHILTYKLSNEESHK